MLFVDGAMKVSGQFRDITKGIISSDQYSDIDFSASGICGNFYMIKKDLIQGTTAHLINQFISLADNLYLAEQGIIDIFIQRSALQSTFLSNSLYTPHPGDWPLEKLQTTTQQPYFLHSWSRPKFWDQKDVHPYWLHFYYQWVALGGSSFYRYH